MIKLPNRLIFKKVLVSCLVLFGIIFSFAMTIGVWGQVYAQNQISATDFVPEQGAWVEDGDVTFAGRNATRATDLIDYALNNYQWSNFNIADANNPFTAIWSWVRNAVYALLLLTILVAAGIIIITRGRSLAVKQFIGRFVLVVVLIFLSFSIIQFIYVFFDAIQSFFLRDINGNRITARDLLFISFRYNEFVGYRKFGVVYDESVSVSLLLVKITAATYYAMFLVLMIRKIILWFFIVISPIFPLLLLFPALRNSAKIWMGEFFRWTLYGPLFALFLGGMVGFWQRWDANTPLPLNYLACAESAQTVNQNFTEKGLTFNAEDFNRYPTAINILLGGPCQVVSASNNLNSPDAFLQYIVALIMLWAVMLVPWILLRIFLDYFYGFQFGDSNLAKYAAKIRPPGVLEQYGLSFRRPPNPPAPTSPGYGTGMAKDLPVFESNTTAMGESALATDREFARALTQNLNNANSQMKGIASSQNQAMSSLADSASSLASEADKQVVAGMTGLGIPTMQDIVKYETGLLNSANSYQSSAHQAGEVLNRVAGMSSIMTPSERQKSEQARDSLLSSAVAGNVAAAAAVQAIGAINPDAVNQSVQNVSDYEAIANITSLGLTDSLNEEQKIAKIKAELQQEVASGNIVAGTLLKTLGNVDQNYHAFSASQVTGEMEAISRISGLAKESSLTQSEKVSEIVKELEKSSEAGNGLAAVVLNSLTTIDGGPQGERVKVSDLEAINRVMSLTQMSNLTDVQKLNQIKSGLMVENTAGNQVAGAILKTISTAEKAGVNGGKVDFGQFENIGKIMSVTKNPALSEQEKIARMKTELEASASSGNPLASVMLDSIATTENAFPDVNRVQKVNLSDYEEVRKTWRDNYERLEPPQGPDGHPQTNQQWVSRDLTNIDQVIALLNSKNSEDVKKGRQMVATLLPFLLLGGFSKTEVIAYLKAKQEAAKSVLEDFKKKEGDKENLIEIDRAKTAVADKVMHQTVDGENSEKQS